MVEGLLETLPTTPIWAVTPSPLPSPSHHPTAFHLCGFACPASLIQNDSGIIQYRPICDWLLAVFEVHSHCSKGQNFIPLRKLNLALAVLAQCLERYLWTEGFWVRFQ